MVTNRERYERAARPLLSTQSLLHPTNHPGATHYAPAGKAIGRRGTSISHTAKTLPPSLQQANEDVLANTQAIRAPPSTTQLHSLIAPNGHSVGDVLNTGGKSSWRGGNKHCVDRKNANHRLRSRSGEGNRERPQ